MRKWKLLILAGTAVSLGACDWLTARNDDDQAGNDAISAEGKAEAGQVAVKAPGFDVSFTVPKGLSRDVKVHSDIKILYPKAAITGMYAAAGSGKEEGKSEVELRFSSADAPDRIAAWYQDPARSALFKVKSAGREGADTLIRGQEKGRGGDFSVRLAARAGGGTDGRLVRRESH
jgi:hypothetical protein